MWPNLTGFEVDRGGMSRTGGEENPSRPSHPLRSEFEQDPDLRDLVMLFVQELDDRMDAIRTAFLADDLTQLQRLAHQLKGSAGGYGFGPIGDVAGELEAGLLAEQADLSLVQERMEDLATICRAAVGPKPRSGETE